MIELPLFPTQEIGSLQKPGWRVDGLKGKITEEEKQELIKWGKALGLEKNADKVLKTIKRINQLSKKTDSNKKINDLQREILQQSQIFGNRLQEVAGLDIVYDGEQTRVEMYEDPISDISGFEFKGQVRSFDVMRYRKAACVSEPKFIKPYHLEEFLFVKKIAKKEIKVPITGAYTLAEWSFNEYYGKKEKRTIFDLKDSERGDRKELCLALAKNVIHPNIKALVDNGLKWIQIDEPAATTHPGEVDLVVESFNESIKRLKVKASVHMCFSDYKLLFPAICDMKAEQFAWEFSDGDSNNLGISRDIRKGYHILDLFNEYSVKAGIGLGVLNVHVNSIEHPELVRDRVLYAAKVLGPEKVFANPDCGLRTRVLDVAFSKLRSMVEGVKLARAEYESS